MQQCGNVSIRYNFDAATVEEKPGEAEGLDATLVGVSNSSLRRLNDAGLLRPLDDLVARHRGKLERMQLIRLDGRIMAIAVAANTQVLMVLGDLLKQEGLAVPQSYQQLIAVAERIKATERVDHPLSLPFKNGWNAAQFFVDLFLGLEDGLLDAAGEPRITGESGLTVLTTMKKLATLLPRDYPEADPPKVLDDLLKFRAPMAVLWGTSAGPLDNPAVSRVAGKMEIYPAPAMRLTEPDALAIDRGFFGKGGLLEPPPPKGVPASTIWWDGFAIAASASKAEAEAAFKVALEGLDEEMLAGNRDIAAWLIKGYRPGRLARGIIEAVRAGAPLYPASPELQLLQRALAPHLTDFLSGEVGAEAALAAAEKEYRNAAAERDILRETSAN